MKEKDKPQNEGTFEMTGPFNVSVSASPGCGAGAGAGAGFLGNNNVKTREEDIEDFTLGYLELFEGLVAWFPKPSRAKLLKSMLEELLNLFELPPGVYEEEVKERIDFNMSKEEE